MYFLVTTIDSRHEIEQMEFCESCWEKQEASLMACYINYDVFELRPSESSYCDECGVHHPSFLEVTV